MGYDGQGIGKRIKIIINLIVAKPRVKHDILSFNVVEENSMSTKVTFLEEKDIIEFACSSKERETKKR